MSAWFPPHVDYKEMVGRICLNGKYEEYVIHDFELSFDVHEYTQITGINRLCEVVLELEGSSQKLMSINQAKELSIK
ncbi:antirestriction protein ArdA [Clostridium sp. UBA1056]|uniref:antirestriction protein ArdA n=1 Tax=Clostridium sp. TaxID=1506 RepID=UPI003216AEB8